MLEITLEPWSNALGDELIPLAVEHFAEVDGGVEDKRRFNLDRNLMQALQNAGAMVIGVARENGKAIGYFTWQVSFDVESAGLLVGFQGAWYVAPGYPRAAVLLFDATVAEMKRRGVQCVFPHHRNQGRGAAIGKFFMRRGAKPIQTTYSLWIGD